MTMPQQQAPRTPTSAKASASGASTHPAAATARTLASEVYGYGNASEATVGILERHRHRYEVNPDRVKDFEASGLYFTGRDETGVRMEIAEMSREQHPFFLGEWWRVCLPSFLMGSVLCVLWGGAWPTPVCA
jgi:CTP synthase (UTP-ammonia lyase)